MAIQVIKQGSHTSPEIIRAIQQKLVDAGFKLKIDGLFGPLTDKAIREFQAVKGLKVDGIVGEKTLYALSGKDPSTYIKPVYKAPVRGLVLFDHETLDIVDRALRTIGAPIKYHLEYPNGGTDPTAPLPCDEHTGNLDCSGFNAWVQGFDRYQKKDFNFWNGYINTDSKIFEAEHEGVWFTIHENPEVGDMIVGESFNEAGANDSKRRVIGHEGTVVDVSEWDERGLAGIQVVHCSPSNYKYTDNKSAIFKTNGTLWSKYKTYRFLRFNRENIAALRAPKE